MPSSTLLQTPSMWDPSLRVKSCLNSSAQQLADQLFSNQSEVKENNFYTTLRQEMLANANVCNQISGHRSQHLNRQCTKPSPKGCYVCCDTCLPSDRLRCESNVALMGLGEDLPLKKEFCSTLSYWVSPPSIPSHTWSCTGWAGCFSFTVPSLSQSMSTGHVDIPSPTPLTR